MKSVPLTLSTVGTSLSGELGSVCAVGSLQICAAEMGLGAAQRGPGQQPLALLVSSLSAKRPL